MFLVLKLPAASAVIEIKIFFNHHRIDNILSVYGGLENQGTGQPSLQPLQTTRKYFITIIKTIFNYIHPFTPISHNPYYKKCRSNSSKTAMKLLQLLGHIFSKLELATKDVADYERFKLPQHSFEFYYPILMDRVVKTSKTI